MQVLSADEMASAASVQNLVDLGEELGHEQTTPCPVRDSINSVGVVRAWVALCGGIVYARLVHRSGRGGPRAKSVDETVAGRDGGRGGPGSAIDWGRSELRLCVPMRAAIDVDVIAPTGPRSLVRILEIDMSSAASRSGPEPDTEGGS